MTDLFKFIAASILLLAAIFSNSASACEITRKIAFAGNDWNSAQFNVEVARYIVEKGYGCRTESFFGSQLPLLQGVVQGKIDVNMEVWVDSNVLLWQQALDSGQVVMTKGIAITDARRGYYIPRFITQGDPKKGLKPLAPDLTNMDDLDKYYALFKANTNSKKGRFYNCVKGWVCNDINIKKMKAYGLAPYFSNYSISSVEELRLTVLESLEQDKPIFFYYWSPSALIAKHGEQLQVLNEPPFNQLKWNELNKSKTGTGVQAVAYPQMKVSIAVSKKFSEQAPELVAFLDNYTMPTEMVNEGILYLNDNIDKTGRDAAINFLLNHAVVWKAWLPAEIAAKVQRSLPVALN